MASLSQASQDGARAASSRAFGDSPSEASFDFRALLAKSGVPSFRRAIQRARQAVAARREREPAKARPAKPRATIAQVPGSGTEVSEVRVFVARAFVARLSRRQHKIFGGRGRDDREVSAYQPLAQYVSPVTPSFVHRRRRTW